MKILMVLTSHDQLGDTGRKTGFWLEEFAAPYYTFLDAGAAVTLASPKKLSQYCHAALSRYSLRYQSSPQANWISPRKFSPCLS